MASPSLRKPPSEQHFSELNGSCGKAVRNQTPLTEAGREGAFLTRPAAKAPDWAWATVSNASTPRAIGQRCVYSCELVCGNWGTEPCLHGVTSSLLDNPLFVSGARHPAKLALCGVPRTGSSVPSSLSLPNPTWRGAHTRKWHRLPRADARFAAQPGEHQ